MGNAYRDADRDFIDYGMAELPGLPGTYRGPIVDTGRPYVACIGAAQTLGRFCKEPFPLLLQQRLGVQVQNLGVGGVSARHFDRPAYLEFLDRASLVVVQVMSGRSESNSMFDNRGSGSLRGRRVADGEEMRFEEFLEDLLRTEPPATVERVVGETRDNWLRHGRTFLRKLRVPKVLLWLSVRRPDYRMGFDTRFQVMGHFPQLVDRAMVEELSRECDAYVECVSKAGLPQPLWPAEAPVLGTELRDGMLYNAYYPSPEMHREAAAMLEPVCLRLLRR